MRELGWEACMRSLKLQGLKIVKPAGFTVTWVGMSEKKYAHRRGGDQCRAPDVGLGVGVHVRHPQHLQGGCRDLAGGH